jgi:hypothetical protein
MSIDISQCPSSRTELQCVAAKWRMFGIKTLIRVAKGLRKRLIAIFFVVFILLIAVPKAHFAPVSLDQPEDESARSAPTRLRAAIIDQASLSPAGGFNGAFVGDASKMLEHCGYSVSYYPGEQISVRFFKNLPKYGFSIIILRIHSSATLLRGEEYVSASVSFFTSEPYSLSKYLYEQATDQVFIAFYDTSRPSYYFSIGPHFITSSMNGEFNGATIITTGCDGLNNTAMAEAFLQKGAKVYIGWDKAIFFSHTDAATGQLLRYLLEEKQTIKQAVENAMRAVGPDPAENSTLTYYPLQAGGQTVQDTNKR